MKDFATLDINNNRFDGWQSVSIERSLETISGGFELSVTERWSGQDSARQINEGDQCTVKIGSDVVITGYVDDVNPSFDSESHSLAIQGRDNTGDLVDCSTIISPGQWRGYKLEQIARALLAPFNVPIKVECDTGEAFKDFSIQQGETVFQAIERMCRLRAVLPISDGKGSLIITRAGSKRATTALVEGENILKADGNFSHKDRFSTVIVKGQTRGDQHTTPEVATKYKGMAFDPGIKRYRPLLVLAEGQANTKQCQDRAGWEIATRYGKATRINLTVQGWRQENGQLWEINTLVSVKSAILKINTDLLIVSTRMTLDDQSGTLTEMELVRPEAYQLIREIPS